MKSLLKNKRAVSPVIATVILVAVTIVVAVSVAYWMGTISTSYTSHEQIEMPTSYAEYTDGLFVAASVDVTSEPVGIGDLSTMVFYLDMYPVTSLDQAYLDGSPEVGCSLTDQATGEITFTAAPGDGVVITADYVGTADLDGWKIHIGLKNTGSADSTIDNIFLNDKPIKDYSTDSIKLFDDLGNEVTPLSEMSVHVAKGTDEDLTIWIQEGVEGCNSGVTINLKIHSAAGNLYPVSVKLP